MIVTPYSNRVLKLPTRGKVNIAQFFQAASIE